MTREEQIAIASCAYGSRGSSIDFTVGAKWADSHPKSPWISVKDDLPCNHEELLRAKYKTKEVFILRPGGFPKVDCMIKINGEWRWFTYKNTKYWMPVPELLKE